MFWIRAAAPSQHAGTEEDAPDREAGRVPWRRWRNAKACLWLGKQQGMCVGREGVLLLCPLPSAQRRGEGWFRKSSRDRAKEGKKELKGRKALRSSARWLII